MDDKTRPLGVKTVQECGLSAGPSLLPQDHGIATLELDLIVVKAITIKTVTGNKWPLYTTHV